MADLISSQLCMRLSLRPSIQYPSEHWEQIEENPDLAVEATEIM